MSERVKWTIPNSFHPGNGNGNGYHEKDREILLDILDSDALTAFFQPIFSSKNGKVYGYEALARINATTPLGSMHTLFKKAIQNGVISTFDVRCRENAIKQAAINGINTQDAYLFINICPETLTDPAHRASITEEIAAEWGVQKDRIILEITEESAIQNYELFKRALGYYKGKGYKIAIDDFGAGYGGLKMLSVIEPDFIKIDRHFISNINLAMIKFNLVDAIVIACHRIGIKVIAEGIENEQELETVLNLGIELMQGFHLARPSDGLSEKTISIPRISHLPQPADSELYVISDIAGRPQPILPESPVISAFRLFIDDPELRSIPIVEDERVLGLLSRNRFLENKILGRYGYGFALNQYKTVSKVMEKQFLLIEANTPLEDVARRIQSRKADLLYDDICITKNGKYFGTVSFRTLLDALTDRNIMLARGANPLTGLPGNESIQREISKRLAKSMHFDVSYIDIDNFKPFNDYYGFERGDFVIKTLSKILSEIIPSNTLDDFSFVGHIGGDDFILITRPQVSIPQCEQIIALFEAYLEEFHGREDFQKRFYISRNRDGKEEQFDLLSLSIGIVSTEVYKIDSYAQLASIATEVKKAAKMKRGASIIRDRRMTD